MASIIKAAGLYTDPNQLDLPEGALSVADNVVIRRDGIVEPRRGHSAYAAETANRLFVYGGRLLERTTSNALKYDNGSGTFTAQSGTFVDPDTSLAKMRAAQAKQNLYLTTSTGVFRLDSYSAAPVAAGVAMGLAFDRPTVSATSTAGNMSLTSNVVTVNTAAANSYYTGQYVALTSVTEAPYATGAYQITRVDSDTFTYAYTAGNDAANANTHTFERAILVTAGGFLTDGNAAAYRYHFDRPDANTPRKYGAASGRTVIANTTGTAGWITTEAKNTVLRVTLNSTDHDSQTKVLLYRSKQALATVEPSDELFLCYEAYLTQGQITAGFVDIIDIVPDAVLGASLYVNPSEEGIEANNYRPPLAREIVAFRDAVYYGYTTRAQAMELSLLAVGSPNGLQNGDQLVLLQADSSGPTFTATTSSPPSSTQFLLDTAGSISQNVRNTALNLVAVINRQSGGTYYAEYISSGDDPPGRIRLTRTTFAATQFGPAAGVARRAAFVPKLNALPKDFSLVRTSNVVTATISAGAHLFEVGEQVTITSPPAGFGAGPHTITATTSTTFTYAETAANSSPASTFTVSQTYRNLSDNEAMPHRVFKSKPVEPEAVPLLNYDDLGSKAAPIRRIVATRDSLFAFKDDGLYRGNGEVGGWSLFDPTVILLAPDSVVVLGNQVYAWCTEGVAVITDTGSEVISAPIKRTLLNLQRLDLTAVKSVTFAIADDTRCEYRLHTISAASETTCSQAFIYNTVTQAWTRDTRTTLHGLVNPTDDKLYLAGSSAILKERYSATAIAAHQDFADINVAVTVTAAAVDGSTITLSSATGVTAGDIIQSDAFLVPVRITAVASNTLTVASEDAAYAALYFPNGAATAFTHYTSIAQWAPNTGGAPGEQKFFRETALHLGLAITPAATLTTSTDVVRTTATDSVSLIDLGEWTTAYGVSWDGTTETSHIIRRPLPQQHRRANELVVRWTHAVAWAPYALHGLEVVVEDISERVRK